MGKDYRSDSKLTCNSSEICLVFKGIDILVMNHVAALGLPVHNETKDIEFCAQFHRTNKRNGFVVRTIYQDRISVAGYLKMDAHYIVSKHHSHSHHDKKQNGNHSVCKQKSPQEDIANLHKRSSEHNDSNDDFL